MTSKYFDVPFANSGDKTSIPDASQPSGDVSFEDGWTPDYAKDQAADPNAKDIPRQSENYFKFTVTEALKEIQEIGSKPYDPLVNYPIGAVIPGSDTILYKCLKKNGPGLTFLPVIDPVGDVTETWIKTGLKVVYITSSQTYIPPVGVKALEFIAIGGGGGGGGVDGQGSSTAGFGGGGGGGGGAIKDTIIIDASYAIVIGAGGVGIQAASGVDGGSTTVISISLSLEAFGGGGGTEETASGTDELAGGGSGGIGTGGDLNTQGSPGNTATTVGGSRSGFGNGGASLFGGGGKGQASSGDGDDVVTNGAGGGGAGVVNVTTNYRGGNGFAGIVIIKEHY